MKLEGIHHVTAITGDGQRNVDFYVGVMGLRLVKKTVNQDDPRVYHLFYADERGSAGSDITFFEFPHAGGGHAGAGMVHTVGFRVASEQALEFWAKRLQAAGIESRRESAALSFFDPEGLGLQLRIASSGDQPLIAEHPEIPAELALQGFDGVRAYAGTPGVADGLLERLGFDRIGAAEWEARGAARGGLYGYDEPPEGPGVPGAGTVHHVAWATLPDELGAWRALAVEGGAHPTPTIDRFYFRSIYFREPTGVLFEVATLGPGFTVDEPLESLGETLSLPPDYEHLRARAESTLTPLRNPREGSDSAAG